MSKALPHLALLAAAWILFATARGADPPSNDAPKDTPSTPATQDADSPGKPAPSPGKRADPRANYTTDSIRGRVVWMAEAMHERFGVGTDPDARQSLVAIETPDGELHPIVKDFRGRGFHLDPRLHELDLELLVRRFHGSPMIQVVRVHSWKSGIKHELDYWCDICSIPMYELKECECCQGEIRIRERPVDPDDDSDHDGLRPQ